MSETSPLDPKKAEKLHENLNPAWKIYGPTLHREFTFSDFKSAFSAASQIADLAESKNHHPDMEVGWGYLRISLTTHSVGGLTEADFDFAANVDTIIS